jgi:pantoate--beta-alanine ligase
MNILEDVAAIRAYVGEHRAAGKTISFVPTMGALHEGHIKLVREGLARADICIPYIFLNPTQFAPGEDLDKYPKTLTQDIERLEAAGASALYLPRADEVYPNGPEVTHTVPPIALPLEGEFRPHMFAGVMTVLDRMFDHCKPDIALFGEKDYQQLQAIRYLVDHLNLPIQIIGVPTVRDENGLALSSRNAYLSPAEYRIAIQLNKVLEEMAARVRDGEMIDQIEDVAHRRLEDEGFEGIDYAVVRDADTLLPPDDGTTALRVLAAVRIGHTRLIDNMPVMP